MADITRWDPLSEFLTLRRDMDRIFDEMMPFRSFGGSRGDLTLSVPIDLYETNDEIVIKALLPGVKPSDIDIQVMGNQLMLKGHMRDESEQTEQNYYRREVRAGQFMRQITLPTDVISDKAQANFEDGILRLRLPKAETAKARSIKVNAGPMLEGRQIQGMEGKQAPPVTGKQGMQTQGQNVQGQNVQGQNIPVQGQGKR